MLEPKQKVTVDYEVCEPKTCDKGGICFAMAECPRSLLKQEAPYDPPYVIPGFCQECAKCVEVCPLKAIHVQ